MTIWEFCAKKWQNNSKQQDGERHRERLHHWSMSWNMIDRFIGKHSEIFAKPWRRLSVPDWIRFDVLLLLLLTLWTKTVPWREAQTPKRRKSRWTSSVISLSKVYVVLLSYNRQCFTFTLGSEQFHEVEKTNEWRDPMSVKFRVYGGKPAKYAVCWLQFTSFVKLIGSHLTLGLNLGEILVPKSRHV